MQHTLKGRFHRPLSDSGNTPARVWERVSMMYLKKVTGPRAVKLPDGTVMTRADLPPADTRRWVASRKMKVVRGVLYGLIGRDEAVARYGLSHEEFQEWVNALSSHGAEGLKATNRLPAHKDVDNPK